MAQQWKWAWERWRLASQWKRSGYGYTAVQSGGNKIVTEAVFNFQRKKLKFEDFCMSSSSGGKIT
jgi:hypothetical protein